MQTQESITSCTSESTGCSIAAETLRHSQVAKTELKRLLNMAKDMGDNTIQSFLLTRLGVVQEVGYIFVKYVAPLLNFFHSCVENLEVQYHLMKRA